MISTEAPALPRPRPMIGKSPAMRLLLDRIGRFAPLPWPVLLLGETGTGKEVAAHALHRRSPRRRNPFVATNVAAIPDALFESELFGHLRGAFTGAQNFRTGLLESANGGTLFLDEIHSLAPSLQEKLLRVLQEKEIRRVGSDHTLPIDVRFITATNLDLARHCEKGNFRWDLYHRLHVLPITLSPLRERKEDLPQLGSHILDRIEGESGRSHYLTPCALKRLQEYDWPGNIRELENVLRYAVAIADSEAITEELFAFLQKGKPRLYVPELFTIKEYSRRAVEEWGPQLSRKELAARLGISRKTLWEMRKRWGLS